MTHPPSLRRRDCPACGLDFTPGDRRHFDCLADEHVGWALHPFPPAFFRRVSVQALSPLVVYVGPLPQRSSEMLRLHESVVDTVGFVYVISNADYDVLYIGKTVNPTGRLGSHKQTKDWWDQGYSLTLLAVTGNARSDTDRRAFFLESMAIRDLFPRFNVAGVV